MRSKVSSSNKNDIQPGTLYVVATPIGNLGDLTRRAEHVLAGVDGVLAEDTRRTRRLLSHLGISARLEAHHEHNEARAVPGVIERLLDGTALALVSDAGTPAVADPGYRLVCGAIEAGVPVVPVPGASAVLAALVGSGLPMDRFTFAGYPPRKNGPRRRFLQELENLPGTVVLLESPRRIAATLAAAAEILGDRPAALGRELTKVHEEFRRGGLAEISATLEDDVRGEITLCIGPSDDVPPPEPGVDELRRGYEAKLREGIDRSQAVRQLATDWGLRRRDVYRALHLQTLDPDEDEPGPAETDVSHSGVTE
ncbi:MAG TPA: 16S rRNA (cytidine(1402)-2'-O)-methyltransferase [Acidobacteriota bacterium]|nr:16S rRNA (cytidine(1402)-2'-O)-methyltransferase [Acidobacteriota bacterium]